MEGALLYVLCVDEEAYNTLIAMEQPGMHIFLKDNLEHHELIELKKTRSLSEYCWTLKPVFLIYILERYKKLEEVAYLDSDLFFLDNPIKIFRRYYSCHILLTTHRVNKRSNGGFVAFRRSKIGHEALLWWRKKCIEWCYAKDEEGKFADQGYLDVMRKLFDGVCYADMPGVNIAYWNCFNYDFSTKGNAVYVDGSPLIFFHLSGFSMKKIGSTVVILGAEIPCIICQRYLKEIRSVIKEIEAVNSSICDNFYLGM